MKEFFFTLIVFCLSHPKPYVSHLISLIFFHFSSSFIYFSPTLFSWETCVSGLWLGKYMVLESYISEIWDFLVNGENIIFFMHYILFTYAFPKFPFNVSLLVATDVHVNKKVCNLINTKIWNLKLSNLKPTKLPTWETFEIWGNSLCHFLLFCPNLILGNLHFYSSFDTRR